MVSSLMRSLIGSILGFSGTETVGIAGPSQFDLDVADQAEFIICDQSIDEVFLTINGKRYYLWRAVDQDDNVLDILVQSRRNKHAAKKFFRKLLKGLQYVPRVIITDKLKSYGAAKREILPGVEHRQSRYLNNRCENSHRPTRQRERRMQGLNITPRGRTMALDRRTPWSRHCILDTQSWAYRLYIHRGIWPGRWPHQ